MSTAIATVPEVTDPRELALLKAVGLDRVSPEQRELALNIANRYELDLMLKHLVMVDGRPYITRDGLLHVAHRSGQLDGIECTDPVLADGYWRASCSVYRKDMSRPFTYSGRYPENGSNKKFAPEMATKVAEVMALRRAFDVAAPAAEERWDMEVPTVEQAPRQTLAERAQAKATEVIETTGLTKAAFMAALKANEIPPKYAAQVRMVLFPDGDELSDEQRQQLFDALVDTEPYAEHPPEEPVEAEMLPLDDEERELIAGTLK
jgi:hypothetical protein